jgi:predicted TIM-barrel fold metal-dependent hydrolase
MCLTCGLVSLPGASEGRRPHDGKLPPAAVDHHLHIQGPEVTAELKRRAERAPELFSIFNPALLKTRTGQDALDALDEAGIGQGILLSMAYTFASPRSTVDPADVVTLTRRENEYNVAAALNSGGRLEAFIGVNPFADFAIDELQYWACREGVSGLKLHMGNSGFDWESSSKVEKLANVFGVARVASLPVVIHVRSSGAYTPSETRQFIEKVLPRAGDMPVQIAHAGGGGGLDEPTVTALALYAEAIDRGAPGTKNLVFDLAAVLVRDITDADTAALVRRFVQLVRKIGLSKFVMGSDWPSLFDPREHNDLLESQISLTADEWGVVLSNRAPYLQ